MTGSRQIALPVPDGSEEQRTTPPTVFAELAEHVVPAHDILRGIARHNPQRDALLFETRRLLDEQIAHDARWNYDALWTWTTSSGMHRALNDHYVRRGLQRLHGGLPALAGARRWSSNRAEFECFQEFQQFYCDALSVAHRLAAYEQGAAPPRPFMRYAHRPQAGESATADRWVQAVGNALDQALPDGLELRPWRSAMPSLRYSITRSAIPRMPFSWLEMLDRMHNMYTQNGVAALVGRDHVDVEIRDHAGLLSGTELIDGQGRTRHNIILGLAHRHSTLDIPLMGQALGALEHVVWASELYFPPGAARDPHTILVRSGAKSDLTPVLRASEEVLSERGLPLAIYLDGSAPYVPYGQQMRIKRGIRLLVDYLAARDSGPRRTLLVPMTIDDTMGLVRKLEDRVVITFHAPLCIDDVDPAPKIRGQVNYGDPLLNYFESLFACHSSAARHGWRTPRVIETVKRVNNTLAQRTGIRAWLKRRLHASLTELGRDQAVREGEER